MIPYFYSHVYLVHKLNRKACGSTECIYMNEMINWAHKSVEMKRLIHTNYTKKIYQFFYLEKLWYGCNTIFHIVMMKDSTYIRGMNSGTFLYITICKRTQSLHNLWKYYSIQHAASHSELPGSAFSYKLWYIVGFWLVEMAISTNQKPTIYRNLYVNTGLVQGWCRLKS